MKSLNSPRNKQIIGLVNLAIVCNVCIWLLFSAYDVYRPVFAVEYFALAAAALLLPLWCTVPLALLVLGLDTLGLVSAIYYFGPLELLLKARHAPRFWFEAQLLPPLLVVWILATLLDIVLTLRQLRSERMQPLRWAALTLVGLGLTVLADMANGSLQTRVAGHQTFRDATLIPNVNIATSLSLTFAGELKAKLAQRSADPDSFHRTPQTTVTSAVGIALGDAPELPRLSHRKIVVVLVESWGLFKEVPLNGLATTNLTRGSVAARYDIQQGTLPFHGSTTSAGMRELCSSSLPYTELNTAIGAGCLPNLLHERGYDTVGLHGYKGAMFDRSRWWPITGMHHTLFEAELAQHTGNKRCGSYLRGLCDADVLRQVAPLLQDDAKRLVYVLTLNSHAPIPADELPQESRFHDYIGSDIVVGLMDKWKIVFDSVATLATDPATQDTQFILVGDHKPHLWDPENSELFSATRVPYLILTPKGRLP